MTQDQAWPGDGLFHVGPDDIPGFEVLNEVLDGIQRMEEATEAHGGTIRRKAITLPKDQADILRQYGARFPFQFSGWEVRAAE